MTNGHPTKKFFINLASGGTAAAISKITVASIERVKLMLQTQDASLTTSADKHYDRIVDVLACVSKEQGSTPI